MSGTVTFQGQPAPDVQVTFHPSEEETETPRNASGVTDADGHYQLTTINTNDGAVPGQYVVTFFKPEASGGEVMDPENPGEAYDAAMQAASDVSTMVESTIPGKYADPATSPEKRTVVAGQDNSFDFQLTE